MHGTGSSEIVSHLSDSHGWQLYFNLPILTLGRYPPYSPTLLKLFYENSRIQLSLASGRIKFLSE